MFTAAGPLHHRHQQQQQLPVRLQESNYTLKLSDAVDVDLVVLVAQVFIPVIIDLDSSFQHLKGIVQCI